MLFPKVSAVLAVGIGATSREFRRPCATIRALRLAPLGAGRGARRGQGCSELFDPNLNM